MNNDPSSFLPSSIVTQSLTQRPRRLRQSVGIRRMVRQVKLSSTDFIYPLFVTHGVNVQKEIASMPGQYQWSVDRVNQEVHEAVQLGIPAIILFGIPEQKDKVGSDASDANGIVQQAIREIKTEFPDLVIVTDVCLCQFTTDGHCGLLRDDGQIANDETLGRLGEIAVSQARSGADIVAPSGMMDGMVAAIRDALDKAEFQHVSIMSYSVKYSSAFYGPFRDAADGAPKSGDRSTHQMDPAENRQPLREAKLDVEQGADFLMVKPALAYLDVIRQVRDHFPDQPLVAYNVSGEYSMIKAASANGWLDEKQVVLESLTAMKRAGTDSIISYHAKDACKWLKQPT